MKGRYTGASMSLYGAILPGAARLGRISAGVSRQARQRLKWMDFYEEHQQNARLTCRHFGISPDTFYRWRRRYDQRDLTSLEDDPKTRRPRRLRQPTTPREVVDRIKALRECYPRWGKDKLAPLLWREGLRVSISTVGRVMKRLKERGQLVEPIRLQEARRRRKIHRPYARRMPRDYAVHAPGDLVQVDTLNVEILPGVRRKQFTGRDCVSRWDVVQAYHQATSRCATLYLDQLQARMPFTIRALQIDGGSEFRAEFEIECQRRGIELFVLPPASPKLNGKVERAQRTHREEFYEVVEVAPLLTEHNRQLHAWELVYNTIRPHQALGFLTPKEYYLQWKQTRKEKVYGI